MQQALTQALELLRSGQSASAAALLTQVLAASPAEPDALQLLGMIARGEHDNEKAAMLFRQSLASRPEQPHVLNSLGNALLDLQRTEEAITAYRDAVRLKPSYTDALTNLGLAHLAAGDAEAARIALDQVVHAAPRDARAWAAMGRALRASDQFGPAIDAFATSLRLRPDHVPTLHNLAVALRLAGRAEEAMMLLQRCAAADPNSAEIRYNLGHAFYDLGQLDEAVAAYRAAVKLRPDYRDAHDSLNRLYWQIGDMRAYLESYTSALREYPGDAGLFADLANRLNLGGRAPEAMHLLEDARSRGVDGPELRHRLGQACWAEGRHDTALDHYRHAIALSPATESYPMELARAEIILEDYAKALETLRPVLARSPFDQQAIAYQGLAQRYLGDPAADRLNDYESFIKSSILQPPPEWGDVATFNARLEATLARLHTTNQHPLEQTLRGGTQTMGELLDRAEPEIVVVRRMIEQAVGAYIDAMADDPDHAFLGRKSSAFRFAGSWSVRLRSQGFHLNHVHSEGWISSCYYVALPKAVSEMAGQQGWIKFGETSLALGSREHIARTIQPEVGKLVLFPSYMYHGTVPFDEDACRTTIAFDVVPS